MLLEILDSGPGFPEHDGWRRVRQKRSVGPHQAESTCSIFSSVGRTQTGLPAAGRETSIVIFPALDPWEGPAKLPALQQEARAQDEYQPLTTLPETALQ